MVAKPGRVVRTEGVSLLGGNIADIEDSYNQLHANERLADTSGKSAVANNLERESQDPNNGQYGEAPGRIHIEELPLCVVLRVLPWLLDH